MRTYLDRLRIPYSILPNDPNFPLIIHITGTKGKGSTCAFVESILRNTYGLNTGMFTSPHLISPRERCRVNGKPIGERQFAEGYWKVHETLKDRKDEGGGGLDYELPVHPTYFHYLTLLSLYILTRYESPSTSKTLDVIILEVGMGGRYDATNVFTRHDVSAITTLDLDHTRVLGDTLEKIAWEKGGIIKPGCLTLSSEQPPGPNRVLREIAFDIDGCLEFQSSSEVDVLVPSGTELGLKGSFQRLNASLAVAVTEEIRRKLELSQASVDPGPGGYNLYDSLALTSWPGRCQRVKQGGNTIYLDGAHTSKSTEVCVDWFESLVSGSEKQGGGSPNVLVFNCSHERDPLTLLTILKSRIYFDVVVFSKSDTERPSAVRVPTVGNILKGVGLEEEDEVGVGGRNWQETLAFVYPRIPSSFPPPSSIHVTVNVGEAMGIVEGLGKGCNVLVTGSLYIVGSALERMSWREEEVEYGGMGAKG